MAWNRTKEDVGTAEQEEIEQQYIFRKSEDGTTKYCPPQGIDAKTLHPRVALKFVNNQASCPYCGLKFKLKARE